MKHKILFFSVLLYSKVIFANNITISNVSLSNKSTSQESTYHLNFDVAWENSWRTSTNESNYDGAWVFFKYRLSNTSEWKHLNLIQPNYSVPAANANILIPNDGTGLFIYRNANGTGNVNFANNYVIWDYQNDGVQDNQTVEIKAFAIEMVYIPQGPFYLGSGVTEAANFYSTYFNGSGASLGPFYVTDAGPITIGSQQGQLLFDGLGPISGTTQNFRTGYLPFWVMKYETSQIQYADFMNSLTALQAFNITQSFYITDFTGTYPNILPTKPTWPVRYVGGLSFSAYADWTGLRPITEMEYEKACRGANITPVPNEMAWGSANTISISSVTNSGLETESVALPTNANATINSTFPTRVGIYARPTGSSRELSGATYYGVQNMGDNLTEVCVGLNSDLSKYSDVHGDGILLLNGQTDVPFWSQNNYCQFLQKGASYKYSGNFPGTVSARSNNLNNNYNFSVQNPYFTGVRFGRSGN